MVHPIQLPLLCAAYLIAIACGNDNPRGPQVVVPVPAGPDTLVVTISEETRDLVLLAREHDRADRRDSARLLYTEAARGAPLIADWLLLRAAGVTPDSAERRRLYRQLTTGVARDREQWTEAFARERTGDIEGAIRTYTAVGALISAFRLRLARARDAAARDVVRRDMLAYMTDNQGAELARDALALFDQTFPTRTAQEQLVLARTAASAGRAARAVSGFDAAFRAGLGTGRDRYTYGNMLARLNRHADAAAQYTRVTEPADIAAAAHYQLGRMHIIRGNVPAARTALRNVTSRWPTDTSAAAALLLLADLATDENRDQPARAAYRDAAQRFPDSRFAPMAMFKAALIAYVHGDRRAAAGEFSELVRLYPTAADAAAARYWSGRAWLAAGDRARAEAEWRELMNREPGSYYTVRAAARLNVPLSLGDTTDVGRLRVPPLDSGLARARLLESLEMRTEARHEYDRLFQDADQSPQRLLATAEAFSGTDHSARAVTLGWRLLNEVGRNPRHYRIVYPVLERERIITESRANGLDPVLVAALIRQESNFNPRATSPVGARGLMQIMPAVGQQLARAKGISGYTTDMLYDPGVNVALGTMHLRNLLGAYPNVERALAAYNAGASRVRRWSTKAGMEDPEVFTERIPFVETRGYVRALVRNRAFYEALYSW